MPIALRFAAALGSGLVVAAAAGVGWHAGHDAALAATPQAGDHPAAGVAVDGADLVMPGAFADQPTDAGSERRVLVNVSAGTGEIHAADQALTVARACLDRGLEVTIFLNVKAPSWAAPPAATIGLPGKAPVQAQLVRLAGRGAEVLVARGCAGVCDVDGDALVEGARLGTAGDVVRHLRDGAVVIGY